MHDVGSSASVPGVVCAEPGDAIAIHAARGWAATLTIPLVERDCADKARFVLFVTSRGLDLRRGESIRRRGVRVDFAQIRRQWGGPLRHRLLRKAVGSDAENVVDATAGLGRDAFLMACMGYRVLGIERSPIVHALLADGMRRIEGDRAIEAMIDDRLNFTRGDAISMLGELSPRRDVVFLDPMFPPKRRKSALPRLEVQLLREIVGDDPDAASLFEQAMRVARQRVVVKRADDAPPLAPRPSVQFGSKLVRYDVYLTS